MASKARKTNPSHLYVVKSHPNDRVKFIVKKSEKSAGFVVWRSGHSMILQGLFLEYSDAVTEANTLAKKEAQV